MAGPYDDIIHLTYKKKRKPMLQSERAVQFAPFAALSGHDEAVKEVARWTDDKVDLGDSDRERLNIKFQLLKEKIATHPHVTITYFQADGKKEGGSYLNVAGTLKKIDAHYHLVHLADGKTIPIHDIVDVECDVLFKDLDIYG